MSNTITPHRFLSHA